MNIHMKHMRFPIRERDFKENFLMKILRSQRIYSYHRVKPKNYPFGTSETGTRRGGEGRVKLRFE